MRILSIDKILLAAALLIGGCSSNDEPKGGSGDDKPGTDTPAEEARRDVKAPLYWSVYEYCWKIEQGQDTQHKQDLTEAQWDEIINYVSKNLLPAGYGVHRRFHFDALRWYDTLYDRLRKHQAEKTCREVQGKRFEAWCV